MNIHTEALLFAEDLMSRLMSYTGRPDWAPLTSGRKYGSRCDRMCTDEIAAAVWSFCGVIRVPLLDEGTFEDLLARESSRFEEVLQSWFPGGFSSEVFLRLCAELASKCLVPGRRDRPGVPDRVVLLIKRVLVEFMQSGQFDQRSGWFEMHLLAVRLGNAVTFSNYLLIENAATMMRFGVPFQTIC